MSKKLIAFTVAVTLIFVGVFAACNNNDDDDDADRIYIEGDEYDFVTDENGERVLNENGEFIIYYTDENGKIVENENGEKVTVLQDFVPVSENNIIEDYGYKVTLPEGWKTDMIKGKFINEETGDKFSIDVITSTTYADNYQTAKLIYENAIQSGDYEATFEEDITDMGKAFGGLFRLTARNDEFMVMLHVFVNNENLYCITYESKNPETTVEAVKAMIGCVTFKPYQYYVPTTESTTSTTSTTAVATTKTAN